MKDLTYHQNPSKDLKDLKYYQELLKDLRNQFEKLNKT